MSNARPSIESPNCDTGFGDSVHPQPLIAISSTTIGAYSFFVVLEIEVASG
jgi:hypothetical protein